MFLRILLLVMSIIWIPSTVLADNDDFVKPRADIISGRGDLDRQGWYRGDVEMYYICVDGYVFVVMDGNSHANGLAQLIVRDETGLPVPARCRND